MKNSHEKNAYGWNKQKKKSKNKNHAHMENCKLQTASHPLHIWSLRKSICMFSKVSVLWRLTKQINYC